MRYDDYELLLLDTKHATPGSIRDSQAGLIHLELRARLEREPRTELSVDELGLTRFVRVRARPPQKGRCSLALAKQIIWINEFDDAENVYLVVRSMWREMRTIPMFTVGKWRVLEGRMIIVPSEMQLEFLVERDEG